MAMNERLHVIVVLSSRKEAFVYVRQEKSWVSPFAGLHAVSKRIIVVTAGTRTQIPLPPARRLVTIMTDVSQLFTFGFFIGILLNLPNISYSSFHQL
jgi:hypothetical protein